MLTLLFLAPILIVVVIVSAIVRLFTLPFRHHHRGFGHGGYHRHRHGFGGLGTVLFLLALDRIFGRRF